MKVQAIIPSAGLGLRMNSPIPKSFVEIDGVPLIVRTVKVFEKCAQIDSCILVCHQEFIKDLEVILTKYNIRKVKSIIPGGRERKDSVLAGLRKIDADTDFVVVHDGARPFLSNELLVKSIQMGENFPAVITGVPVKSTIKEVDPETHLVRQTLKRELMWEIQTPQIFKKDVLEAAHNQGKHINATDDAALVEALGESVKVIEGDYDNIKITTQEDLVFAQAILRRKNL